MDRVTKTIEAIKEENEGIEVCACLGLLSDGQADRLRTAGADAYNHNLNTSEETYGAITTTHTYADRVETVQQAQAAGLSARSWLIAGMGESDKDLVDVVFALRDLDPDSVPVNFLIPFEGTPLAKEWNLTPQRCLRILAMVRFVCPDVEVRLAGGREVHLRSMQPLALHLVNSIFLGDYLTSEGQAGQADLDMIADAGFEVEGAGTTTLPRHRADALGGGCGTCRRARRVRDPGARGLRFARGRWWLRTVRWPRGAGTGGGRRRGRSGRAFGGERRAAYGSGGGAPARCGNGSRSQCLSRTPPHSPSRPHALDAVRTPDPPRRNRTPPTNCGRSTARTSGTRTVRCPAAQEPLIVESASGVRLRLAEPVEGQRELVDGMSSWWSAVHGYNHPVLNEAARGQLDRMSHVMFGGLTHEPAVRLATRLVEITPGPLRHVFLADSGSVSVEVAVKMCLQYWRSAGRPAKRRLLDLARGLPRGHLAADVRVRSGGRDARAVVGLPPPTGLRRRPACRFRRGAGCRVRRTSAGADRRARRGVGGGRRGAGGAGGRRDVLPLPRLSAGAARGVRRARRAAGPRRDRDRVRAYGQTVRRRSRRDLAGRHVPRQGADRWLSHDGGDAVHHPGGRGHLQR
ncbi:Biotin synthase [Streptomyces badius]